MLDHDEKSNSDNFPPNDCVVYSRLDGQTTSQYWPIVCFLNENDRIESVEVGAVNRLEQS